MIIDTKIDINDEVYIVDYGVIRKVKVYNFAVSTCTNGTYNVSYNYYKNGEHRFHDYYKTKEEAGLAMLKANGLDLSLSSN